MSPHPIKNGVVNFVPFAFEFDPRLLILSRADQLCSLYPDPQLFKTFLWRNLIIALSNILKSLKFCRFVEDMVYNI